MSYQKNPGIYKILNTKNNKVYIGSAVSLERRIQDHKYRLRKNIHKNSHLQSAWNKYKEESFEFSIIEYINDVSKLIQREQFYIDTLLAANRESGYNMVPDAITSLGIKRSPETIKRISEGHKGLKQDREQIEKRRLSLFKPIAQFDLEGNLIRTWNSISEASKFYNYNTSAISKVLTQTNKSNKTTAKFIWTYIKDDKIQYPNMYAHKIEHSKSIWIPVYGIHKITKERIDFENMNRAASAFKVDRSSIKQSIKSNGKWASVGYYWFKQ